MTGSCIGEDGMKAVRGHDDDARSFRYPNEHALTVKDHVLHAILRIDELQFIPQPAIILRGRNKNPQLHPNFRFPIREDEMKRNVLSCQKNVLLTLHTWDGLNA